MYVSERDEQGSTPRSIEQPFSMTVKDADPGVSVARFVAAALLELGERLSTNGGRIVTDLDDDRYLRSDAFALLVGVLLDHGVPAERAWRAPSILRERMGHLDPRRLLEEPAVLERAFFDRPMPHRFPATATRWVLDAAQRVVEVYGGDTARIWDGGLRAIEIRARLEAFSGIGQKKAAMAVEILATHLGVPMTDLAGSDVAYDIHVRRVFMRTGLVEVDTLDAIVRAARTLHPARPGLLDVPAWTVGREWCRPRRPRCTECPISWACPSAPVPVSAASA